MAEYVAPTQRPRLTFVQQAASLAANVRDLACDHLELAALDARLAANGLARLVSATVIVSVLAVTAWLAAVAAGVVWVTSNGMNWPSALLVAAALNLALAGAGVWWARRNAGDEWFAATLRELRRTRAAA